MDEVSVAFTEEQDSLAKEYCIAKNFDDEINSTIDAILDDFEIEIIVLGQDGRQYIENSMRTRITKLLSIIGWK